MTAQHLRGAPGAAASPVTLGAVGGGSRAWRPEASKPYPGSLGQPAQPGLRGPGRLGRTARVGGPAGGRARAGGRWAASPGEVGGRVYFCSSGVYVNEKRMELQTARRLRCGRGALAVLVSQAQSKGARRGWGGPSAVPRAPPGVKLSCLLPQPPVIWNSPFGITPPTPR